MGDQLPWFKLWCSVMQDRDLQDLSLEDFGRWCLFGVYLKQHGRNGVVTLRPPARSLCSLLRVMSFDALLDVLRRFPNCIVDCAGRRDDDGVQAPHVATDEQVTVGWRNWRKYQVDSSAARMRRLRKRQRKSGTQRDEHCDGERDDGVTRNVTTKRRGDERRRDIPQPLEPSARDGPRAAGTNPRAQGTNPRATGMNPRAQGTNPRAAEPDPRVGLWLR